MDRKRKGYVLPIAIVAMFVLAVTALTVLSVVYRYAGTVNDRRAALAEQVYDAPDGDSSAEGGDEGGSGQGAADESAAGESVSGQSAAENPADEGAEDLAGTGREGA